MTRIARPAVLLGALVAAAIAISACGGDDNSSSYKQDASATVQSIRTLGNKIGTTITGAASQSDSALAQQFDAIKTQTDAALTQVKDLKPPGDSDKKLVDALVTSLTAADSDIGRIDDAITANDPTGAKDATAQLVKDSPAVKAANNALGLSVGVSPAKATAGTPAQAATIISTIASAGTNLAALIKGAKDQTDVNLAKQIDAVEKQIASAYKLASTTTPPAAQKAAVAKLNSALTLVDSDLTALSSAVSAHDVAAAKSGTRKLLQDYPQLAQAAAAYKALQSQ